MSGILQGCPASGSLCVLAIDPFLRMLKKKLPDARTKAFADDLATMLKHLKQINVAEACFDRFKNITGLSLKPPKCKIVPLGGELTSERKEKVAAFVR